MGYASTVPFVVSDIASTQHSWTNAATLTTVAADYNLGDITTIDFKNSQLQYAFATLYAHNTLDTSGALNYWAGGYVELDDGVSTQNCGYPRTFSFMTPANGCTFERRRLLNLYTENIIAYLKPNTQYAVTLKNAECLGNNLILYRPKVDITILGGV